LPGRYGQFQIQQQDYQTGKTNPQKQNRKMTVNKTSSNKTFLTEYTKENGQTIIFPEGFKLIIKETSHCVYQIELYDEKMRSISNHGTDLDKMVEKAIEDLYQMRK
jgi:hypothetical protein